MITEPFLTIPLTFQPLSPEETPSEEDLCAVCAVPPQKTPWDLFLRTRVSPGGSPQLQGLAMVALDQFILQKSWRPIPVETWNSHTSSKPPEFRSPKNLVQAGLLIKKGGNLFPTRSLARALAEALKKYSRRPGERPMDSADPDHPMYNEKPRPGWRSIYDEPASALE